MSICVGQKICQTYSEDAKDIDHVKRYVDRPFILVMIVTLVLGYADKRSRIGDTRRGPGREKRVRGRQRERCIERVYRRGRRRVERRQRQTRF